MKLHTGATRPQQGRVEEDDSKKVCVALSTNCRYRIAVALAHLGPLPMTDHSAHARTPARGESRRGAYLWVSISGPIQFAAFARLPLTTMHQL